MEAFQEVLEEYGDRIIPSNHPVSQYVQNITERIINSAGLGRMKCYALLEVTETAEFSTPPSMRSSDGKEASHNVSDAHQPEEITVAKNDIASVSEDQEWEIFVVRGDSTIDAFVLPGLYIAYTLLAFVH